jgi:hypothetical protein
MDARAPRSSGPGPAKPTGPALSPEQRVEDMVRHRLYGPHMRWNVEPAVRRQTSSTILPSFPPAANRS